MSRCAVPVALFVAGVFTSGCGGTAMTVTPEPVVVPATATSPTADEARAFIEAAEREIDALSLLSSQAQWVAANFITEDTEALSAEHTNRLSVAIQRNAMVAGRFDRITVDPTLRRKLTLLKLALSAPPPGNDAEAAELTRLTTGMEADYGRGTYCAPLASTLAAAGRTVTDSASRCLAVGDLSRVMATSRDPATLLDAWRGWHAIGAPLRTRYSRFVELSNKGARELGFEDLGALWRSNYDMPPTNSRPRWSGSGSRCGRCMSRCTRTCGRGSVSGMAASSRRTG